jgi:vancomycin resistance protein YoaR
MGITRVLSSYPTAYAGTADRVHNLQLAVSILDGTLVAPGATFSLNRRLGERTAERGFRSAPVIMNDKYEEAIGGGVSQVATTVFNAAWEAGLKIAQRVPHSLYISRYPVGRDATVNYPDLDLKFVNDTPRWLLVRGSSDASGIAVSIYGARTGRRVESSAGSLVVTGPTPVERTVDRSLPVGTTAVDESGVPPQSVTVTRTVYNADGSVRARERWNTAYRGEPKLVRVGGRPKTPAKPKAKKDKKDPTPTTTGATTTTPETAPQP